jgi:hypothetical protein
MGINIVSWNIRRLCAGSGWEELNSTLCESASRTGSNPWDIICIQEQGFLKPCTTHHYVKSTRHWGAAIIIHEFLADRVTFSKFGCDWALVILNFSDLDMDSLIVVSTHLPPRPNGLIGPDPHYQETLAEVDVAIRSARAFDKRAQLVECHDANVDLPSISDHTHNLTGPLCDSVVSDRAVDFLEHLDKHGLLALNTFPNDKHMDAANCWTFLNTRGKCRLIDFVCFSRPLTFSIDYSAEAY